MQAPHPSNRKQLAGPPSEFPERSLPSPTQGSLSSQSALLPFTFTQAPTGAAVSDVYTTTMSIPCDSSEQFAISVFSPHEMTVAIYQPGSEVDVSSSAIVTADEFGINDERYPATSYTFMSPVQGVWTLTIKASASTNLKNVAYASMPKFRVSDNEIVGGYVLVFNKSPIQLHTRVMNYDAMTTDSQLGLRAAVFDASATTVSTKVQDPTPLKDVITEAFMQVELPDGDFDDVVMDDSAKGVDTVAADGIFHAAIVAPQAGDYLSQVLVTGTTAEGVPFVRTTEHLVSVVNRYASIGHAATAACDAHPHMLHINVDVSVASALLTSEDQKTVRAYAEVWGTSREDGSLVPVAWVSSMTDLTELNGQHVFTLQLHRGWLALARASAPLYLHNVYVQDRETFTPVSVSAAHIPVAMEAATAAHLSAERLTVDFAGLSEASAEMLEGPRPDTLFFANGVSRAFNETSEELVGAEGGKLLLVHGYCAPGNPFPTSQFSNWAAFNDPNANRANDEFALMIREFGSPYASYGIVCHSQGGLASTHLKNYYWSGLDATAAANEGRLIQSLGSPYRGTSIAGLLASIGDIFGVGCGKATEMTHDGAALWLSGIGSAARSQVYYYTTQYATDGLIHACNVASNTVLSWPNDGVTELDHANLDGATNMGHVKGWCHSDKFSDPPQYTDASRNAVLNNNARR